MTDYVPDVQKYTDKVNTAAVAAIVKYCGNSLHDPDAAKVQPLISQRNRSESDGSNG